MVKYHNDIDIEKLKLQLKEARSNLERIRSDFKDDSQLLSIYEPSAQYFVEDLENTLISIASKDYDVELQSSNKDNSRADIWVSLEGEEFKEGTGPIGQVGAFLTKLYHANKQATAVVSGKRGKSFKPSEMPSLNLVATKAGSLKLGLNRPEIKSPVVSDQLQMFEDNWEQFKEIVEENELPAEGMQLLVKAIASVQNEEVLGELMETYGEKEVIKIIHYAKELVPSNRSPIDFVKFEGDYVDIPMKSLKTDKETRKLLTQHAKKLLPTTEFIEGIAYIGQADVNGHLVARPLMYSGKSHEEIRCVFVNELSPEEITSFLNKKVEVKGFMVSDRNGRLLRLEVDQIELIQPYALQEQLIEGELF